MRRSDMQNVYYPALSVVMVNIATVYVADKGYFIFDISSSRCCRVLRHTVFRIM